MKSILKEIKKFRKLTKLNESLIPVDKIPKNEDTKKKDGNTVAVWDIENAGWRSFRVDCITNIHK